MDPIPFPKEASDRAGIKIWQTKIAEFLHVNQQSLVDAKALLRKTQSDLDNLPKTFKEIDTELERLSQQIDSLELKKTSARNLGEESALFEDLIELYSQRDDLEKERSNDLKAKLEELKASYEKEINDLEAERTWLMEAQSKLKQIRHVDFVSPQDSKEERPWTLILMNQDPTTIDPETLDETYQLEGEDAVIRYNNELYHFANRLHHIPAKYAVKKVPVERDDQEYQFLMKKMLLLSEGSSPATASDQKIIGKIMSYLKGMMSSVGEHRPATTEERTTIEDLLFHPSPVSIGEAASRSIEDIEEDIKALTDTTETTRRLSSQEETANHTLLDPDRAPPLSPIEASSIQSLMDPRRDRLLTVEEAQAIKDLMNPKRDAPLSRDEIEAIQSRLRKYPLTQTEAASVVGLSTIPNTESNAYNTPTFYIDLDEILLHAATIEISEREKEESSLVKDDSERSRPASSVGEALLRATRLHQEVLREHQRFVREELAKQRTKTDREGSKPDDPKPR